jgi:putative ABC transport system permease protein
MLRHILIAAWRNMAANKLLSAIAIIGLAVGITAMLTVVSVIRGINRWDQFIPGYERTFVVAMPATRPGAAYTMSSDARIAGLLKLAMPEIENTTRLVQQRGTWRHGNVTAGDTFYWADPTTFAVLPYPVYRGDLKTALKVPGSLVLARVTTRKYFGRDDVVGETLTLNGHPMIIRAVIEDINTQTELDRNGIFVSDLSPEAPPYLKGDETVAPNGAMTFLRLKPGADIDTLRERAHDAVLSVLAARPFHGGGPDSDAPLLLRIDRSVWSEKLNPGFHVAVALGFAICGLLLFLASINFVNMMTARAVRRAVEVSMRKACGASRGALIVQFLGESILTVFFATCLALALNEWLLGRIGGLGQAVPFDFWDNPPLLGALLLGIAMLGVAAGAWPAFVLSSFRPIRVLKGISADVGHAGFIRNGLVTLQFAALTGLIIAVIVLYQQHQFAMNRPLGLNTDQVLMIHADCQPAFVSELRMLPGVEDVSCTGSEFLSNDDTIGFAYKGTTMTLDLVRSDWRAFALYGIRPLAGSLNASDPGDRGIVLNRLAVRKLGFASPEAAIGQTLTHSEELAGRHVIAVVPDFALYSIERPLEATLFVPTAFRPGGEVVITKLRSGQVPQTLVAIGRVWTATGHSGPALREFYDRRMIYSGLLQSTNMFMLCVLVAMFLACLGLTGLTIANAERRTKEIGIRKAMGAGRARIVGMLLFQFSRPVLWANVIAWPVAWWLMRRWLSGFAYHVDLHWWVFAGASLGALAIALLTVAGQAFLTARQKPVLALRYE